MEIIFSDNKSRDIVEHEAMNAIRSMHGITHSADTILNYSSSEMRNMLEKEREGAKRFDWDTLTYKDKNGDLINLVCDRIDAKDEKTKQYLAEKITDKLLENIVCYYKREFEEKVEESIEHYEQYGSFEDLIL